jgi:hypothetical protein
MRVSAESIAAFYMNRICGYVDTTIQYLTPRLLGLFVAGRERPLWLKVGKKEDKPGVNSFGGEWKKCFIQSMKDGVHVRVPRLTDITCRHHYSSSHDSRRMIRFSSIVVAMFVVKGATLNDAYFRLTPGGYGPTAFISRHRSGPMLNH